MQLIGYVKITDEIIKVLVRVNSPKKRFGGSLSYPYVCLKLRTAGALGQFMQAESEFLEETPADVARLKAGETIKL